MKITAHCLVKNEARFVWYSVMSVIDHVDKVLLWDTGSTDETVKIIKEIKKFRKNKVDLRFLDSVTPDEFAKVRQQMLDETISDWFIVVDGDEIWWEESIRKVVEVIKSSTGRKIESIVVPMIYLIGDIYHRQEEAAGQYTLAGRKGHLGLRGINSGIPGLASRNPHGTWGWVDGKGKMIQYRNPKKILFIDAPYLHATHLVRASSYDKELDVPKRTKKFKYELGIPFPLDFYYPEVFFRKKPSMVPSPWIRMDFAFWSRALVETPARKIKRRVLPGKTGY